MTGPRPTGDPTDGLGADRGALLGLLMARGAVGVALALLLPALSVDDYFRPYHAVWMWQRPSLAPSAFWLPGYAWAFAPVMAAAGALGVRLVNLGLHLGTGAVLARAAGSPWAAAVFFASPLSLRLGQSTLSEPLFGLAAALAFLWAAPAARGGPSRPVAAGIAGLAAALVRYDGFALAPLLAAAILGHRGTTPRRRAALGAALPFVAPAVWVARSAARGDPLLFLSGVRTDAMGVSEATLALVGGPYGAGIALGTLATAAAAVLGARRGVDRVRAASLGALGGLALALAAIATENVPTQSPERIVGTACLLGAVPLGWALARAVALGAGARALVGAALLASAASAAPLLAAPSALDAFAADGLALAERADARGATRGDRHLLVVGPFPSTAAVVALGPHPTRAHVEGAGRCALSLLGCRSRCETPGWARSVGAVVAPRDEATLAPLREAGLEPVAERGALVLFESRDPGRLIDRCAPLRGRADPSVLGDR